MKKKWQNTENVTEEIKRVIKGKEEGKELIAIKETGEVFACKFGHKTIYCEQCQINLLCTVYHR